MFLAETVTFPLMLKTSLSKTAKYQYSEIKNSIAIKLFFGLSSGTNIEDNHNLKKC